MNKKAVISAICIVVLLAVAIPLITGIVNNEPETTIAEATTEEKKQGIVNGVVCGTDGWLYYNSTLGDYTGSGKASDRKVYNAAHNIVLMQEFVQQNGASFVFTAAPNKNSLYYENMPDEYVMDRENSNIRRFYDILRNEKVNFVDLFSLFGENDEVYYLKTDSHWNNKGALLAYNSLLDAVNKEHDTYSEVNAVFEARESGDLEKALNPDSPVSEENYYYEKELSYSYKNNVDSVEAPLILTENAKAQGSLLMFRDSFGNALLPFLADSFEAACFSKGVPYILEKFMNIYSPDTVITEVAERNVTDYAVAPPVFTGPSRLPVSDFTENQEISGTINLINSTNDMDFLQIYGTIYGDEAFTEVYVDVNGTCYEAFTVSDTEGDYSYLLYLKKNVLADNDAEITVYIASDEETLKVSEKIITTEE